MPNSSFPKESSTRRTFNSFSEKYPHERFHHGHIRHQIHFIEREINFLDSKLRFCLFTQDYVTTYLTVFDDSKKTDKSQGKVLVMMSTLIFEEDNKTVKEEVVYFYNDALVDKYFVREVHFLFAKEEFKERWPVKNSKLLHVATNVAVA